MNCANKGMLLISLLGLSCSQPSSPTIEPLTPYTPNEQQGLSCDAQKETCFFVATDGSDSQVGSANQPFASVERAQVAVNAYRTTTSNPLPTKVIFREGTYEWKRALQLRTMDSGSEVSPVTYLALPSERVVISGGKSLTLQWRLHDAAKNIYVADISAHLAEFPIFRSLYVDDQRTTRARTPNGDQYFQPASYSDTTITYQNIDINPQWANLTGADVVAYRAWFQTRSPIKQIDFPSKTITTQSRLGDYYKWLAKRYFIEGFYDALDAPGEWHLDAQQKKLYYIPLPGKDIQASHFIIPTQEQLIHSNNGGLLDLKSRETLPTSRTFAYWIKPKQVGNPEQIYATISSLVGDGKNPDSGLHARSKTILESDGSLTTTFAGYSCSGPGVGTWGEVVFTVKPSDLKLKANQWYFVTERVNYANPQVILTVYDGTQTFETTESRPSNSCPNHESLIWMGRHKGSGANDFTGELDDISIWNSSLSNSAVSTLVAGQGKPVPQSTGLLAYFNFEAYPIQDQVFIPSYQVNSSAVGSDFPIRLSTNSATADGRALRFHPLEQNFQSQPVKNIRFENLIFAHTDWSARDQNSGGSQAANRDVSLPALEFENSNEFTISNCRFENIGGTALAFRNSRNFEISQNIFSHLGTGAIIIDGLQSDNDSANIADNIIHDYGEVNAGAMGILAQLVSHLNISHNEIYNGTQSGISLGWDWNTTDTGVKDNLVSYNKIHHVMKKLYDGGGIYTLGNQPGTAIENNLIYDINYTSHHGADQTHLYGIYLDEGSSNMVVRDNLVYRTGSSSLNLHLTFDQLIENNFFIDPLKNHFVNDENTAPRSGVWPRRSILRRNIFYVTKNPTPIAINFQYFSAWPNGFTGIWESNYNLFYLPTGVSALNIWKTHFAASSFSGNDFFGAREQSSVVADPLFEDYTADNFNLLPQSPARAIGILPIDISNVGPR